MMPQPSQGPSLVRELVTGLLSVMVIGTTLFLLIRGTPSQPLVDTLSGAVMGYWFTRGGASSANGASASRAEDVAQLRQTINRAAQAMEAGAAAQAADGGAPPLVLPPHDTTAPQ